MMKLPDSWRWQSIRDVVDLDSLDKIDPRKLGDGEFTYIDIASVDNQSKSISKTTVVKNQEAPSRARQVVVHGDILVSTVRPNLNAVATVGEELIGKLICSTGFAVLRANVDYLIQQYLFFWVKSASFIKDMSNKARGASYPAVSFKVVLDSKIPIPPLEEQQEIINILQEAENLRRMRQDSLDKTEKLASALFLEMFGDSRDNSKNWKVVSGTQACPRISVGVVVRPSSYYKESGVPALRSQNIKPGSIDLAGLVYFSKEDSENKLKKSKLKTNDIVLVRTGIPGTAAVVPKEMDGFNAIDILIATPDLSIISPIYLASFFNSEGGKKIILGEQRGQVQQHLNVGSLKKVMILLPPIELQEAFAEHIKVIEAQKLHLQSQLNKLDDFLKTLQHQTFSGKLTENWRKLHGDLQTPDIKATHIRVPEEKVTSHRESLFPIQEHRKAIHEQLRSFQNVVWGYILEKNDYIIDDLPALIAELPEDITENDQTRLKTTLATLTALGLIAKTSLPDEEEKYVTVYRALREEDDRTNAQILNRKKPEPVAYAKLSKSEW